MNAGNNFTFSMFLKQFWLGEISNFDNHWTNLTTPQNRRLKRGICEIKYNLGEDSFVNYEQSSTFVLRLKSVLEALITNLIYNAKMIENITGCLIDFAFLIFNGADSKLVFQLCRELFAANFFPKQTFIAVLYIPNRISAKVHPKFIQEFDKMQQRNKEFQQRNKELEQVQEQFQQLFSEGKFNIGIPPFRNKICAQR